MSDFDRAAAREELHALVKERALQFGDFLLASGQRSTYYFDGKQVSLDSRGAYLMALLMLDLMSDWETDAVGGMSIGADPITGAVCAVAGAQGRALAGVIVRKEPKARGTRRQVEGPIADGARIVIVEDAVTTGGSSIKAIEALRREVKAEIVGLVALVDRMEGGKENLGAAGCEMRSIFTVRDFGIEPPAKRAVICE
jgi:orotate phosphoribosyltransferase